MPVHFTLTSASVMNAFFVPQLGSMIYTMNGMTSDAEPAARTSPARSTAVRALQRRRLLRHAFRRARAAGRPVCPRGSTPRGRPAASWTRQLREAGQAEHATSAPLRSGMSTRPVSEDRRRSRSARRRAPSGHRHAVERVQRGHGARSMLGKLTWAAIPFDQPIPLIAPALVGASSRRARLIVVKGWLPYLWREWITSVDHKRIGVMYCLLALVMLLRGFSDAIMMRSQQALAYQCARLPAAGALRPDLLGARHADDLLRRHAVRDRPDEFRRAAAARRPRRGVPDAELRQLLADRDGRAAGQHLARGRRVRPHRLAALSALVRAAYSPGVGVDYYLWALQISGVGTLLSGRQPRHHRS